MSGGFHRAARSLVFLALGLFVRSSWSAALPAFELPRWETGQTVRLEDYAGQIVVLDFFAYWCVPCRTASASLEEDIQKYYAARNGNPRRIPVRVISINLERANPRLTADFIEATGASLVVNDFSGSLLKQFGAQGLPYLVVLDGTGYRPEAPRFEVVYRHAGFEGAAHLRGLIDSIGSAGVGTTALSQPAPGPPTTHRADAESELLWAPGILLSTGTILYGQEQSGTRWDVRFSYSRFDLEFVPIQAEIDSGLLFVTDLHEPQYGGQFELRQNLSQPLTLLASAGAYAGFQNYRQVWLNNYYLQKYGVDPTYQEADPEGFNVSGGLRWEYLPAAGVFEGTVSYAYDQVAPGYDPAPDTDVFVLLRGRDTLHSVAGSLSSENVLTRRLRLLSEVRLVQTTDRDFRYALQASLNYAPAERWIARGQAGLTREGSRFKAYFGGATLEWEWAPWCALSLTGSYYTDTGEIENALRLNDAAPPVETWQIGLGLRFTWGRSALKLSGGPYFSRYGEITGVTAPFVNLYQDRDWGLAQVAYSVQF